MARQAEGIERRTYTHIERSGDGTYGGSVSEAGTVIGSKYRLLEPLGSGSMGSVWIAQHVDLCSQVAVKFMDPLTGNFEPSRERFVREAQAAAALRGPHVVQVLDHGFHDRLPYIVMELLEGETLRQRLDGMKRLNLRALEQLVVETAKAIGRAHRQGFIHRDLKPDNIFLVDDDDSFFIKVLDFGLAKRIHGAGSAAMVVTDPGTMLGTLHYMSPEQIRGQLVGPSTDLWALSIVVFECATGELPYRGRTRVHVLRDVCAGRFRLPSECATVPPGFDAWFARAMRDGTEPPFENAKELASSLLAITQQWPDIQCEPR